MCFRPPQVDKPIKCPECGAMNPFDRTSCKKCKAKLDNGLRMIKCPACNCLNMPGSDVCDDCGMGVDEIQKMIKAGEASIADVIVAADGSRLSDEEIAKLEATGVDNLMAVADMDAPAMPSPQAPSPAVPGPPKAPSIPTPGAAIPSPGAGVPKPPMA